MALWHESEGWTYPNLVTDCANALEGHDRRMERLGIVAEVGYPTAQRWQVVGKGPEDIHVIVVRIGE